LTEDNTTTQLEKERDLKEFLPIKKIYIHLKDNVGSNSELGIYCNKIVERDSTKKLAIILTGFTCAGKDTVMEELEETGQFYHVVTATTRERRTEKGEPENKYVWLDVRDKLPDESIEDYLYFVNKQFNLIESDYHYGYVYGLPLDSLQKEGQGFPVVRPDINGVITLHKELPKFDFQPISVAVMPDSWKQIYNVLLEEREGSIREKMERLKEDNSNVKKYIDTVNYFLHNTRQDFENMSGLDRSVMAIKEIVGRLSDQEF